MVRLSSYPFITSLLFIFDNRTSCCLAIWCCCSWLGIKYFLATCGRQNCDTVCGTFGFQCARTGQSFPPTSALGIFESLGISCKSFNATDYYIYEDHPNYVAEAPGNKEWVGVCLGFKSIPSTIDCHTANNTYVRRLCPCYDSSGKYFERYPSKLRINHRPNSSAFSPVCYVLFYSARWSHFVKKYLQWNVILSLESPFLWSLTQSDRCYPAIRATSIKAIGFRVAKMLSLTSLEFPLLYLFTGVRTVRLSYSNAAPIWQLNL